MIDKGQWWEFGQDARGYTPTLYKKCHVIFNGHRESGPRFKVSSERQCLLTTLKRYDPHRPQGEH